MHSSHLDPTPQVLPEISMMGGPSSLLSRISPCRPSSGASFLRACSNVKISGGAAIACFSKLSCPAEFRHKEPTTTCATPLLFLPCLQILAAKQTDMIRCQLSLHGDSEPSLDI